MGTGLILGAACELWQGCMLESNIFANSTWLLAEKPCTWRCISAGRDVRFDLLFGQATQGVQATNVICPG